MIRKLKKVGKCLIIYIVICMTILSSVSYGYTVEEVGNAVAGFAMHVVDTYGNKEFGGNGTVLYEQLGDHGHPGHTREDNPIWSPGEYNWGDVIYFDCSSFATGCYHYVTGLIDHPYATSELKLFQPDMRGKFEFIDWDETLESLRIGDLVFHDYR